MISIDCGIFVNFPIDYLHEFFSDDYSKISVSIDGIIINKDLNIKVFQKKKLIFQINDGYIINNMEHIYDFINDKHIYGEITTLKLEDECYCISNFEKLQIKIMHNNNLIQINNGFVVNISSEHVNYYFGENKDIISINDEELCFNNEINMKIYYENKLLFNIQDEMLINNNLLSFNTEMMSFTCETSDKEKITLKFNKTHYVINNYKNLLIEIIE
jgi:hypothetical protein